MSETNYASLIDMYRSSLPPGRITDYRIDGLDHLGIPVVSVDHFRDGGGAANGIGYGATENAARLGAYGELCEELHLDLSFHELEQRHGSYRELVTHFGVDRVIDPLTLVLPAGSDYDNDTPLVWVPVTAIDDGSKHWCPAEFVATSDSQIDYPHKMTTCIRNGSGAGDTLERALLHGALELLQRDGNADCFRALDRGRVIETEHLPEDIKQLLRTLADRGLNVIPKVARTTCGCVSLYAVGDDTTDDPFPFSVTGCGEAADPDTSTALRKAILECASSHSRKRFDNLPFRDKRDLLPEGAEARLRDIHLGEEEQRALRAMYEWTQLNSGQLRQRLADSVFRRETLVPFGSLPTFAAADVKTRWEYVLKQLQDRGLRPYYFRAVTTRGACEVVKLIVPGIEMEFASYHRIGRRGVQRLLAEDPFHLLHRKAGRGRKEVRLPDKINHEMGGPFYLDTDHLDEIIDPLYALYREPTAHAAVLAEETGYFNTSVES
ncbi:YcaO-like family protein [Lewinella sp. IMCC34191]|uniref:YcaO-like family protein n=1 Tax=Lewinella sp. IMCC34191 TaxID=2259172 RepID=UPI000E225544|nr:YcaO-like family protein [Lewinella sp. IMCC34191]